ncbi:MAG: molybdate ABC transporter permease subunit [Gammaproteobacteria bacterium]|nr:molybdate ABC transporter permease subunit [Gammaproteobacteria bacterium]
MILTPLVLTLKLALVTVFILFIIGMPLAWWLAETRSRFKPLLESITALPLVLPPTVLGFYLLILLGQNGVLGGFWFNLTGSQLAFSFLGLVIASCLYSLPFVVQPLQTAFEKLDKKSIEAAYTLGASPQRTFVRVVLPMIRRGLITALVLGFAHTIGEFGVVLMVGGNIPDETQVMSIAIYEAVETMDYTAAHWMSAGLLVFSLLVLFSVYALNKKWSVHA